MVLSKLLRLLLGLVIVVPKLACRPWPLLNGAAEGDVGEPGEPVGEYAGEAELVRWCVGVIVPLEIAASILAATPLAATGVLGVSSCSEGVVGTEFRMALPSSESAS